MITNKQSKRYPIITLSLLLFLILLTTSFSGTTRAQEDERVQVETGLIRSGDFFWYLLPDMAEGQTVNVLLRSTSGNLDPSMGLIDERVDADALVEQYKATIQGAIVNGRDPLLASQDFLNENLLIWDDDGGDGLSSAFSYVVPADGDYRLFITDALTVLGQATSGDYELLIGLETTDVFGEEVTARGEPIAFLDVEDATQTVAVEEHLDKIEAGQTEKVIDLHELRVGDTISVYVEATSGDLRPALILLNYADKPVRSANINGQENSAALEYTVEDRGSGFSVKIVGCCDAEGSSGDYRLLVGMNAPDVLNGEGQHTDDLIIKEPIPVAIGIKLQQIVEVDEQNEFFTAVASMQMEWDDPALAFSPDSCDCVFKTYTEKDFIQFLEDTGDLWPEFTVFNQQGNRWTQNRVAVIWQDGHALYFERFSTNLQVDFDFSKYPFDNEKFLIQIDSIFPEDFYYFTDLEGYSEISADHGEDEFQIGAFETAVTSEQASTLSTTSRFTFSFGGPRHKTYFLLQVFVPIMLILGVLWVTFFLRDYPMRIELASANLLVFIAFGFSLADNYPRLGYLTLLDAVMALTFIISALVIVYNVYLRRLELAGQGELANRIDNFFDWAYPISIVVGAIALYLIFF